MFTINGKPGRVCDGLTRRQWLEVGGLGALGIMLPDLLRACSVQAALAPGSGSARACILVYLFGGVSQIDTWDMKPEAPDDFRGDFKPIQTNVPGMDVCEHFSLLARQADKLTIVRSMNHQHPRHGYGLHYMFTGREHPRPDLDAAPLPSDFPSVGSLVSKFHRSTSDFPPAVTLPRWNRFLDLPNDYAGELAGFLGRTYDPWLVRAEPNSANFAVSGIELPAEITTDRLTSRRALWQALDGRLARLADSDLGTVQESLYRQAFTMATSPQARRAFLLADEDEATRERYGPNPFGQGLLLARRLVEAGTSLVTVNWHDDGSDVKSPFWDTHKDNFNTLRDKLIPPADRGLAALLEDLAARGLLETTMVVVMGEFGRTPRIGRVVMNAATDATGRDHWPHAYSILIAGGGVQGGHVYGASDNRAAHVTDSPVTPPDLVSTILHALGIDQEQLIHDLQGRPHKLSEGRPVLGLF